jgi:hypothetical protein
MKIISNFKDYYDYLQGIYGMDEKVVYERICMIGGEDEKWEKKGYYKPAYLERQSSPITLNNSLYPNEQFDAVFLAICGVIYCVYIYRNKFYFGEEVESIGKKIRRNRPLYYDNIRYCKYHLDKTDINEKLNCPIALIKWEWHGGIIPYVKNIKLTDYGINTIVPAEDMYIQISNFLSREKKIVDKRTNKEKITGHGFDLKTSFRKM